MRILIIVIISLTLSACVEPPIPTITWQNICFPTQYLTPASIHVSKQSDPNFDTDEGAPSIFYEAAYLENKLSNYQTNHISEDGDKLWNPITVSILIRKQPKSIDSNEIDVAPFEQNKNLFKQTLSPYHWSLFSGNSEKLELWGKCYLSSENNYGCMRRFYHNDMLLTYNIHMTNLALYKEIDEFIIDDLTQWQCK